MAESQELCECGDQAELELSKCQELLEDERAALQVLQTQQNALVEATHGCPEKDEVEEMLNRQAKQVRRARGNLSAMLDRVEQCKGCIQEIYSFGHVPHPTGADR